jgi:ABC-type bacteriocin/lantibiotic exporter with double-glycine peptidase domain
MGMAIVAILLITAYEVRGGGASLGATVAAIAILHFLASLVRDLARSFVYWTNYQVARRILDRFLKNPSFLAESQSASDLDSITGQLTFEQVSVTGSLVDVTASVEPGLVVAITGPTGAGKSTLLSLASRLLDPDRGRVLLDGHDLKSLTLPSIRKAVGMVSPSLPLLRGSIKRNILYRMQNASPDDYAYIRAFCELDEELDKLADGDLTEVAEGGVNLPTGLRQRISLARALLGGPVLILMDEPDAGLDPAGRAIIERILTQKRATVLLVTYDQSRIRMADVVWYFESGRLVEQGAPKTLLTRDGPLAHSFGLVPSVKNNL